MMARRNKLVVVAIFATGVVCVIFMASTLSPRNRQKSTVSIIPMNHDSDAVMSKTKQFIYSERRQMIAGNARSDVYGMLQNDGQIRECITGNIIASIRKTVEIQPMTFNHPYSDEKQQAENTSKQSGVRREAFQNVFNRKLWGTWSDTNSGLGVSGLGSTQTFAIDAMATLHAVITTLKLQLGVSRIRLLDMPCGDMGWMSRFLELRTDVDYTGIDIVQELIEHHRKKYANSTSWKFERMDFVADEVPYGDFDLIHCRHALQHLSAVSILKALAKLSSAGNTDRKYLLTTTFSGLNANNDIVDGDFRLLNLELPPIALAPPLCLSRDGPAANGHYHGLWSLPLNVVTNCSSLGGSVKTRTNVVQAFSRQNMFYSCVEWMADKNL